MENIKENEKTILDLSENIFEKTRSLFIIDLEKDNHLSDIKDEIICLKKLILGIRYFLDRKKLSKERDYLNYIKITKDLNIIEKYLEYYFLGKENRLLSKKDGEVLDKMFLTSTLLVLHVMGD